MTDPDEVALALARLASGEAPPAAGEPPPREQQADGARRDGFDPHRVVADAEASIERLDHAAAFVDAGGERRLRRVVADVDGELAERGRTLLNSLEALRAALAGAEEPIEDPGGARRTTSTTLAQRSSAEGS
ncbi:MAG: hypothetical protein ACOCS7_01185 [Halolamina sp.]